MKQIKIDRQSKLFYCVVPDQKFYTRNYDVPEDVVEAIDEFYQKQYELERFLQQAYDSLEGRAPAPEIPPAFLKSEKKAKDAEPKEREEEEDGHSEKQDSKQEEKKQVRAKRPKGTKGKKG